MPNKVRWYGVLVIAHILYNKYIYSYTHLLRFLFGVGVVDDVVVLKWEKEREISRWIADINAIEFRQQQQHVTLVARAQVEWMEKGVLEKRQCEYTKHNCILLHFAIYNRKISHERSCVWLVEHII